MPTINPDNYFKDLFTRTEEYAGKVRQIYVKAIEELTNLGIAHNANAGNVFSFDANTRLQAKAASILRSMNSQVYQVIQGGVTAEWGMANLRNDKLVEDLFGKDVITRNVFAKYFNHNQEAMNAFIDRAKNEGGLGLSEKVWNYTKQLKAELEIALDLGIGEGGSASNMSKSVRSYLKEPDKMFRRVQVTTKDADGNITKTGKYTLSKAAQAYHPGQGVYRSSYKNAMRLTRTETNMAYHASDHERRQAFDFIVGYEVKLSNNHPVTDICNDFAGKYPKTFKFVGWHPQCRCHAIDILCTDDELNQLTDTILNGEEIQDFTSDNSITNLPTGYLDWIDANKDRVATAKSIPYFIKNNYVDGQLSKGLTFNVSPISRVTAPGGLKQSATPTPIQQSANVPTELTKGGTYLTGTDIEFSNDFFNLIDQNKPVGLVIDNKLSNSFYSPMAKKVNISNGSRAAASKWQRESVIYHEYGHAIDWQRNLRNSPEVQKLMDKYRKALSKKQSRTYTIREYDYSAGMYVNKTITASISDYSYIDTRLKNLATKIWRMKPEVFQKRGITKADASEQILSLMDTIMALNPSYGSGHSKAYFKNPGMKEAEFIAHCFENKFATNAVFEKFLPDLYQDMKAFIEVLK